MVLNTPTAKDIEQAHDKIREYVHRTSILTSSTINEMTEARVFFKCENFQKIGAFKFRGACNTVLSMQESQLTKGIATHSSGNQAQAVALAGKLVGAKVYVIMPTTASKVKKKAVIGYGAEVIECEPSQFAREKTVDEIVHRSGATFIHPYNDYSIIAGQATCSKELIEDLPDDQPEFILCPVGGGGLLSGTALSAKYFSPKTKVVGCEPEGADDASRSLQENRIVPSENPDTIADGLLTSLGDKTFPIIKENVDDILLASDNEIVEAMRLLWERMKIIVEPSGAVPLAVLIRNKEKFKGATVGIILSGGNVDLNNLPF